MKFSTLRQIVISHAESLSENAAHAGAWNDGGANHLVKEFNAFKQGLVVQYDLKPSEYTQLEDKDIGEPKEFSTIIHAYKLKKAMELMKDIEL